MRDEGRLAPTVSDAVERSEWLRDTPAPPAESVLPAVQAARAAQVARQWAGLDENPPVHEFGTVRWAGEGDTPDAGLDLSRPEPSESWVPVGTWRVGAVPAGGRPSDGPDESLGAVSTPDAAHWLDRLYGPSDRAPDPAGIPEYDLGSLNRPNRRAGAPAHAANDPGRFRNLVENQIPVQAHGSDRRANWPRKRIVLPMVVLVGVAGFSLGRGALDVVNPTKGQVTLADPPLLAGQKAPSGYLVTAAPKPKPTPTSTVESKQSGGGKHKAAVPTPEATAAEKKAEAQSTGKAATPKAGERPRTTVTSTTIKTPGPGTQWSRTSRSDVPTTGADDEKRRSDRNRDYDRERNRDRDEDRRGRHRKPDRATPWQCDPNYSVSCVPIASDVDCLSAGGDGPAYLAAPARVIGRDIYNLDTNGDGWACERW
ncbi:hypothetical protein LWF15_02605 [Kineosporia rhizophila]|uniref:hypothetical protein n=1 Tax=Kineosporia rhizophila TaxID=84633 RepID=UPI001E336303|nr:hypothetical protein [Kineosporia rhizophila]MCE0534389.1 hypothetical protein [Kineosporia rhizophila]